MLVIKILLTFIVLFIGAWIAAWFEGAEVRRNMRAFREWERKNPRAK